MSCNSSHYAQTILPDAEWCDLYMAQILPQAEYMRLQRMLIERLVDLSESDEGMVKYEPPGLKQRIWNRFKALAGWD